MTLPNEPVVYEMVARMERMRKYIEALEGALGVVQNYPMPNKVFQAVRKARSLRA